MAEVSIPTVDELTAKSERLAGDVVQAGAALDTAKATFIALAKKEPDNIDTLMELSKAMLAAEATVNKSQAAVKSNATSIDGIRYDESMAGVLEASQAIQKDVGKPLAAWFDANSNIVSDYSIDTLTIVAKREESGAITVSVKPTGENMPKRPSAKRVSGNGGGPRGTRSVTVNGESMSCRDYVKSCGNEASPAAQDDLAGTWLGSPVSYTNEAKRLAAKKGDTFA